MTMKYTGQCPKCEKRGLEGKNLAFFATVNDSCHHHVGVGPMALSHTGFLGMKPSGLLQAYVCEDCGYVEFYCSDVPMNQQRAHDMTKKK
jgi:predicted nucleic-acid-binding Zn-ribbon protein